jgi:tetratricopeptide (TPR) repeat protein
VTKLLERGDQLISRDKGRKKSSTWAAVGFYREVLKLDPDNFDALWRLARAYMLLGEQAKSADGHRRLGWKGYSFARRAIQRHPRRVEGHFWAALCTGEYAKGLGVLSALKQGIVKRFRGYLDAAIRIDRSYDEGGPDRVYALYWHSLPWPLKNNKKALQHFHSSLRYCRTNAHTHMYLADVLADEDRETEAERHYRRCISASTRQGDRVLARRCRRLLRELKD